MLLRHHPDYPWSTYVTDHVRLLDAIERRDPATPDLVADHLRLSKDLIAVRARPRRRGATHAARPIAPGQPGGAPCRLSKSSGASAWAS